VHCPYFSDDKQEYWWIYMVDRKRPALATIPVLMTNLVDYEEIELKFTAPTKPGTYKYEVIVRSDSYVDFSTIVNLKVKIVFFIIIILVKLE
jgi:translocation protein SEC63